MRTAVIGAGISGLASALLLQRDGHAVTLFEAGDYLGGHTHTVDVTLEGRTAPVDTGFLVYNERTYPHLTRLFAELEVPTAASDMSFSLRDDATGVEWAGTSLATLFGQPGNLLRPAFWGMLADIARFNREARAMLAQDRLCSVSLAEYLDHGRYGAAFRDWYLVPMAAAIWSSPRRDILEFPLPSFVRFYANHGLLQVSDRPQWRTVRGGGREYVSRLAAQLDDVRVSTPVRRVRRHRGWVEVDSLAPGGALVLERFDAVVLACHSDQALALLADPSALERELLSRVRYQPNRVVLHTDERLLPRRRGLWSAWNYLAAGEDAGERPVAVSYWINRLQPLPFATPVVVTLNPPFEPRAGRVLGEFEYAHPMMDGRALAAQAAFASVQGERRTWFAGAWLGYGFHEDGLRSAIEVVESVRAQLRRTREPAHEAGAAAPAQTLQREAA